MSCVLNIYTYVFPPQMRYLRRFFVFSGMKSLKMIFIIKGNQYETNI